MEKADILEMTVQFLKGTHARKTMPAGKLSLGVIIKHRFIQQKLH